jgi:hypothetical protein
VKGGFPSHHLGEQPAGDRSQREAVMRVAEDEPQAAMTLASPDHWNHIGKAGTPPDPRCRLQSRAKREQFAGERLVAGKLNVSWRCVALSEFDACGQANALPCSSHEQVATVGIMQRMAEPGVSVDAVDNRA